MEFYKFVETGAAGDLHFPASVWLNLLTETEMCAFLEVLLKLSQTPPCL